jgi:phosphomannomutase/phosphomannomutase/phosphoglucomutase
MDSLDCFKSYDIRAQLGKSLNEDIVWRIGRAFGQFFSAKKIVIGGDIRPSSMKLKDSLSKGLNDSGVEVWDLGLTGTEEIYFATFSYDFDAGIEVTGSHNPLTDNGLKFIKRGGLPLNSESELLSIKALAEKNNFTVSPLKGLIKYTSYKQEFVNFLINQIDIKYIPPIKILLNPGNGTAGPVLNFIEESLSKLGVINNFIKICFEPDSSFPMGVPNPLLPENRHFTAEAMRSSKADLGVAWDGDFDRCFFFDEDANFIEGYYIVGLLAEMFLLKYPGATIIHDTRLTWNTIDIVNKYGGRSVISKTGHAFLKDKMRSEMAIYGGEMSSHHYFADFAYCDSGMLPWLLVLELIGRKKASLSSLVAERQAKFPCSGELNYLVKDPFKVLAAVNKYWERKYIKSDNLDGLTLEMPEWRFNLRISNTEPLLRLNIESRANKSLIIDKIYELEKIINPFVL